MASSVRELTYNGEGKIQAVFSKFVWEKSFLWECDVSGVEYHWVATYSLNLKFALF